MNGAKYQQIRFEQIDFDHLSLTNFVIQLENYKTCFMCSIFVVVANCHWALPMGAASVCIVLFTGASIAMSDYMKIVLNFANLTWTSQHK